MAEAALERGEAMTAHAYVASDCENGVVVFGQNEMHARARAANLLGIEKEDIEDIQREPAFNGYAAQGHVPVLALLEQGWWYECGGCSTRVSVDEMLDGYAEWENDLAVPAEPPINIIIHEGEVFCCPDCLTKQQANKAAWQTKKAQAYAQAAARFPGLVVRQYHSRATLQDPAWLVLGLPLPYPQDWRGEFSWEVGSSTINGTPVALAAYAEWKRLRRQLPAEVGQ